LNCTAQGCAVELATRKGQHRVAVQILGAPFIEEWVLGQRAAIDADADDAAERRFGRQVRDPAGHDVEDGAARWQHFAIKVSDCGDRRPVDASRRRLARENGVRYLVDRRKDGRGEERHDAVATHHWLT